MEKLKEGISVVTITLNEEKHIQKFIDSHKLIADEIIVIDSGSTDNTVTIAEKLGATVINNKWQGYSKQWNLGIKSCNYQWVLIGDADHVLSSELIEEIDTLKKKNILNNNDAYFIPRKNIMFGKWIKHGGFYPDTPYPRMFKNGLGYFDESAKIHEKLVFSEKSIGCMKKPIEHYTFLDFETYVSKLNKYTTLEAIALSEKEDNVKEKIFINGKINKSAVRRKLPFKPFIIFIYRYFIKLGFLDGKVGFYMALLSFFYEYVVNMKVWLLKVHEVRSKG